MLVDLAGRLPRVLDAAPRAALQRLDALAGSHGDDTADTPARRAAHLLGERSPARVRGGWAAAALGHRRLPSVELELDAATQGRLTGVPFSRHGR